MAARSAPALGLATACLLVTAVGLTTIRFSSDGSTRLRYVSSVVGPTPGSRPLVASSTPAAPALAPARAHATAATSRPPASTPVASRTSSATSSAPTTVRPTTTTTKPSSHTNQPSFGQPRQQGMLAQSPYAASSNQAYALAVFHALNQSRADQHLPALTWSGKLASSARQHNQAMAAANTLSHQVGDEPSLGARETAAGLRWHFAAENIGWTNQRNEAGALAIEARMFAESPPNDTHRRNILSTSAHAVGIDVLIDTEHGRLWLTEDFADVG